MVGGFTCSACANSASDFAPANTSTESAESCAGPIPLSRSRLRSPRSKWIAAECTRSAASNAFCEIFTALVKRFYHLRFVCPELDLHPRTTRQGTNREGTTFSRAETDD